MLFNLAHVLGFGSKNATFEFLLDFSHLKLYFRVSCKTDSTFHFIIQKNLLPKRGFKKTPRPKKTLRNLE